jgi:cob(I)alamin adenosyltransferase
MDLHEAMQLIDAQLSHVWMVRTFLKHSDEGQDDEDLQEIYRELYDYMLALGGRFAAGDAAGYVKQAHKKFSRLKGAAETFTRLQPEISEHTNFKMAVQSLNVAVNEIGRILTAVFQQNSTDIPEKEQ